MKLVKVRELFDLQHTAAAALFESVKYPWDVLPLIKDFIKSLGSELQDSEYDHPAEYVWIAKTAEIADSVSISGPCIVFGGAQLRHCAFIRGNVIIGEDCVVGNSSELKNVILFDHVQVPHFNYVGDSVLGYKAHLGAGAITSNVKSDRTNIVVKDGGREIETGLEKFGAMLGDRVEIGCNSVLNPGTVVGRNTIVYPLCSVRGVVPADCIYKSPGNIVCKN
ncbi:MAG: UDP-N-acetylglucosamine pyrophosphorylase [Clostridiales bacterium]|nr:UDP-N-acetylglucosamine pyrophosphorylase [Clostridiales bacterium]